MLKRLIDYIVFTQKRLYEYFYHHKPSENASSFIENVSYLGLAVMFAAGIAFVFKLLLIRFLGPEEYGKFSLIFSLTNFFFIPMLLGMSVATTRYVSDAKPNDRPGIIGTALISVVFFIVLTLIATIIFQDFLAHMLKVSTEMIKVSVLLTAVLSVSVLQKSIVQGMQKFKIYSFIEILSILLTTIFWVLLLVTGFGKTYFPAIIAYYLSFGIIIIYLGYLIWPSVGSFKIKHLSLLFKYGFFTITAAISTFLLVSVDKLIINHYFGVITLGVYSVYTTASNALLTNKILFIILTVMFPVLAQMEHRDNVLKKLNSAFYRIFSAVFVLDFFVIILILKLIGREYPFSIFLVFFFALSASLNFVTQIYATLIIAEGIRGVKVNVIGVLIISIGCLFLSLFIIPLYGLYAAVLVTCITNALLLSYSRYQAYRLYVL